MGFLKFIEVSLYMGLKFSRLLLDKNKQRKRLSRDVKKTCF